MRHTLPQELRHALRSLARSPVFTIAAIVSLALGIGANTAIYSAIESTVLNPLGVPNPDGLLAFARGEATTRDDEFRLDEYHAFRNEGSAALSALGAYWNGGVDLQQGTNLVGIRSNIVNGEFFDAVGLRRATAGRLLTPADDRAGAPPVAVLTDAAWRRRFGGSRSVIGQTILLNGVSFTIVGVAAPGFHGLFRTHPGELFVPLSTAAALQRDKDHRWSAFSVFRLAGRLKPGITTAQANSVLSNVARPGRVWLHPATEAAVESNFANRLRDVTLALGGIAATSLLIACLNVAGLLVARAQDRRRELALRLALGASRPQIGRQLFIETLVLFVGGGTAGVGAAFLIFEAVRSFGLPGIGDAGLMMRLDARLLLVTTVVSLVAALLVGLAPVWQVFRTDISSALTTRDAVGGRSRGRACLLAAQVALCLPLLVGTGLFMRSMAHAAQNHPGFDPDRVLVCRLFGTTRERAREILHELSRRARDSRGVSAAAVIDFRQSELISVDGAPREGWVGIAPVSPEYFDVFGLTALRGRLFHASETATGAPVVVINEMLARRITPDGDVLGRRIGIRAPSVDNPDDGPFEVIGVVKDIRTRGPGERGLGSAGFEPSLYLSRPPRHSPAPAWSLAVKTDDPRASTAFMQREARAIAPEGAKLEVTPYRSLLERRLQQYRRRTPLLAAFGAISLLLSVVGLYSLLAYSVSRRTPEIGVRMAIGATASAILWWVVRQGLAVVTVGLAGGTVLSLWTTRLIASELMGVSATDAPTLLAACATLTVVALLACLIPARRAARVDPAHALRCE